MNKWISAGVLGIVGLLVQQAGAIAVADLAVAEQSPSNQSFFGSTFNWDYCYNYKNASSVAIDHYWILTAAHVGDDTPVSGDLDIDGVIYEEQEVVQHPFADLALVRYDKPFPGYYLLADTVPVGSEVMFCGFGFSGNVVSSTRSAYFTDNQTGWRTKRWGSNRIDRELTYPYSGPSPLGITTNQGFEITISTTKANAGLTAYEAGGNIYDSGAGMFIDDNGTWKLVGTMTTRTNNTFNYTGNFAVSTKYHVDWIKSVITNYDTDMDGLPDHWEETYGSMNAEDDPDVDGFSNYEEWMADTDPTVASSHFKIIEWQAPTNVTFSSSSDRRYIIELKENLTGDIWSTEVDWFDGLGISTPQSLTGTSSNGFYRIRVKLR